MLLESIVLFVLLLGPAQFVYKVERPFLIQ